MKVPFLDLARQALSLDAEIEEAVTRVTRSGLYVLTEEVRDFEDAFADYCGVTHTVGVASGTDAITLALMAAGVGPGDEVVTVPNTCIPTVVGIERAGAVPVLADVDPVTYTLDPDELERRITARTKAVVPVHLYGQTADLRPILDLAEAHGLVVVEDCAQAHGAIYEGRRAGSIGHVAAFSFYPTKNLGALGDGGAVATSDPEIANRVRSLRNYGELNRFEHVAHGLNSRLDGIQAAVLSVKLGHLDRWNAVRACHAARYERALSATGLTVPAVATGRGHVFHLYVVQVDRRDDLQAALRREGIGAVVHYPIPVHLQPAYRSLGIDGGFPVAERLASRILSLPLSPEHTIEEIETVCEAIRSLVGRPHSA